MFSKASFFPKYMEENFQDQEICKDISVIQLWVDFLPKSKSADI